jgi:hypothetical protein
MKTPRILRFTFGLLAVVFLGGCNSLPSMIEEAGLEQGPYYTPANFRGDARLPDDVHRVAVLPVHGGTVARPETAAEMDAVLLTALQQQARFEVVVVTRDECRRLFGAFDFSSVAALPHGFLEKLAERYAVDAVLFTDLTAYKAYRPLALGFRAKLAGVRDVRLVWAFDEIFSADDPRMRNSVRHHYRRSDRAAPSDPMTTVMQSPARFGAVAADLMFRTLPPR